MTALVDAGLHEPVTDTLPTELLHDFARARGELAEARRLQQAKDTPARRSAVLDGRTRVDAVLDMYLMYLAIEVHRAES